MKQGGFFVLTLIDDWVGGIPLLVVGVFQVIVVPWIYGVKRYSSIFFFNLK